MVYARVVSHKNNRLIMLLGLSVEFSIVAAYFCFYSYLDKNFLFLKWSFPHRLLGNYPLLPDKARPLVYLARKAIFVFHNFDTISVIASLLLDCQKNGQNTVFFNVINSWVGARGKPVKACGKSAAETDCVPEGAQYSVTFGVSLNETEHFKSVE